MGSRAKNEYESTQEREEAARLRRRVREELRRSGFVSDNGRLKPREEVTKETVRELHRRQRAALLKRSRPFIERWEDRVIDDFANGDEVDPARIRPVIKRISSDGHDAALFRFATLHWSVPVSVGYGRRTRFLVRDNSTGKLIGVFALGDPVFNLRTRDDRIGWNVEQRSERLYNVLDAFVLGAVPPYRELLGAKLVAMAATSQEVAAEIEKKYEGSRTIISGARKDPRLALITTTSALGRSSLYSRLRFRDRLLYQPVGYTEGFGHFQFSDSLFDGLCEFLSSDGGVPNYEYGGGPNWRLRTIRRALAKIQIDDDLLHHGVRRQVFLAPRAKNWRQFLKGESEDPSWYRLHLGEMAAFHRRRWAIPRSNRDERYRSISRDQMRLL